MRLRDFLNEFELDWAQAPVRSRQVDGKKLRGAKVLLCGAQAELVRAVAWSFLAWNDAEQAGIRVMEAGSVEDRAAAKEWAAGAVSPEKPPRFAIREGFAGEPFLPEEADYLIFTGLCCQEVPADAAGAVSFLEDFRQLADAALGTRCRRILLLSDGRVYGQLPHDFFASEYEAGRTEVGAFASHAQYVLQAMEGILSSRCRAAGREFTILRTGLLYGPGIPMMEHDVCRLARDTAKGQEQAVAFSRSRNSYLAIHDLLTAVQFVLTRCPGNKIFNVAGPDGGQSAAELAVTLWHNFPDQCHVTVKDSCAGEGGKADADELGNLSNTAGIGGRAAPSDGGGEDGILLNTQLIANYGFAPEISMEDGLIILVKSIQNTGEIFLFDNTYYGKLHTVQQILLGYLLEIDRICKKYDIPYFLAGGTLLGAVRHHGFIPWDDDADVMMLREDYDRFLQVAPGELPENIFLQLPSTEEGNHNPFTKLRIDDTMFATKFTGNFMEMHNGIFFDILSHDRTAGHGWSRKLHLMATMLSRSVVFNKWGNTDIKSGGAHPILCKLVDKGKYLVPMPLAEWVQEKALTFFRNRDTAYLYDGMGRNLKRGAFPKAWLDEAVYVDFEGYPFPVPKEYDKYLTWLYGDYMQMIPVSSRRTSHSIVLTDLGAYAGFSLPERTGAPESGSAP